MSCGDLLTVTRILPRLVQDPLPDTSQRPLRVYHIHQLPRDQTQLIRSTLLARTQGIRRMVPCNLPNRLPLSRLLSS